MRLDSLYETKGVKEWDVKRAGICTTVGKKEQADGGRRGWRGTVLTVF